MKNKTRLNIYSDNWMKGNRYLFKKCVLKLEKQANLFFIKYSDLLHEHPEKTDEYIDEYVSSPH